MDGTSVALWFHLLREETLQEENEGVSSMRQRVMKEEAGKMGNSGKKFVICSKGNEKLLTGFKEGFILLKIHSGFSMESG